MNDKNRQGQGREGPPDPSLELDSFVLGLTPEQQKLFPRCQEKPRSRRSSQLGRGSALRQRAYSYCRSRHSSSRQDPNCFQRVIKNQNHPGLRPRPLSKFDPLEFRDCQVTSETCSNLGPKSAGSKSLTAPGHHAI